jgi:DNA-binding Lrp family transcriptional regulator
MLKDLLGLDDKDARILSLCMKQPDISQTELATHLKLSQPSINVRLNKLKKRGVLSQTVGIEFNRTNMYLVRVDLTATQPDDLLARLQTCSFFVNGFTMSGTRNVSLLIVGPNLKKVETIINTHLRSNDMIKDIESNVIVSAAKPLVCAIDLDQEKRASCQNKTCDNCPILH